MKSKTFNRTLSKCALTILAALTFVGCSDYDNGYTDKDIAFQQSFREKFGDIDPNHTWSTVTRSTLTVGVDMPGFNNAPYTVRVYTANPRGKVSNCYLLGQWEADSPAPHDYVFDMPAGLKTVWVAVTKQNGGRYVQKARIADHKCTANFTLGSATTRAATEPTGDDDWKYFPLRYYKNDEETGFIQIYPENDVNYDSGICTNFEIVATGTDDIRLTHFYSNTSSADPVWYFIYRPEEQTVQEAFNDKSKHHVLCESASNHIEHYTNGGWQQNGTGIDGGINGGWIIDAPEGVEGAGYTMRGRTVIIPKEDLQKGDHIVFYLTTEWGGGNLFAATRATLNANNTAFAGLLDFGTLTYLGFEDSLGDNGPNGDYDLNDVVYVLEGEGKSFTVEDYEDELADRDMSYIVAYEDLGASEDFDFNDVIVKISRVAGSQKINFSVLAAGGTLPVSIYHTRYGREELFSEIHSLFGVETETVINALPGRHTEYAPIKRSRELPSEDTKLDFSNLSIRVTQADGKSYGINAPQYYDLPSDDEDTYIDQEHDRKGLNVPYAILIADPTWDWPDENQNILDKYPGFKEWVKNADKTDWYGSIWNGLDDEEPDLPSDKMPVSRSNYGTHSSYWYGSSSDQEVELLQGASIAITCYDSDCGTDDWTFSPEQEDEATGSTVTKDGDVVTVTAGKKTGSFELTLTAPRKDKDETTYYREETIKIKVSVVKPNFGDEISKDDMTKDEQGKTYHTNTYTIPASVFESYNAENYVTLTLVLTINEWNYWGQLQYKINDVVYSTDFNGSPSNIHEIELTGDDFVKAKKSGLSIICTQGMTVDAVYIKAGSASAKKRKKR